MITTRVAGVLYQTEGPGHHIYRVLENGVLEYLTEGYALGIIVNRKRLNSWVHSHLDWKASQDRWKEIDRKKGGRAVEGKWTPFAELYP